MWKFIKGYDLKYMISRSGEVKSMARIKSNNQPIPERIMKLSTDNSGYRYVSLYNEEAGKNKRHRVHRLVAEAFIDNPYSKETVNHKNGIKSDNRVENLEWATYGENKSHSFKELDEKHWLKGKYGSDNPYSKKVEKINPNGVVVAIYSGTREASRETGISQGNIASVCRGLRKSAGKYYWRYV